MKKILVKDLMVPVEEYAIVYEDEFLYNAVLALEKAQAKYLNIKDTAVYPHRALLVLDKLDNVVGKLSQLDILRALEPKYQDIIKKDDLARTAASGFSLDFLQSMVDQYSLFEKPLHYLCQKAAKIKVKDCMYAPHEGEVVNEEDSLELAVHQLIVGKHQSLLVMRENRIVGILRLTDVFHEVCNEIKSCTI